MNEWTDVDDDLLRTLWSEGHPTAKIGQMMLRTKNSIVGRSHRLDLPARSSPIQRGNYVPVRTPRPPRTAHTLPPLPSEGGKPRPGEWITAERTEILNNLWPTYTPTVRIIELLAATDGPSLPTDHAIASYANVSLRLYRPADFRKVNGLRPPVPVAGRVVTRKPKPAFRAPVAAPVVVPAPYARESRCVFPIGEPGSPGFRFCDEPHQNKTYCAEHQALCSTRIRDRREDRPHIAPANSRFAIVGGNSGFIAADWDGMA